MPASLTGKRRRAVRYLKPRQCPRQHTTTTKINRRKIIMTNAVYLRTSSGKHARTEKKDRPVRPGVIEIVKSLLSEKERKLNPRF